MLAIYHPNSDCQPLATLYAFLSQDVESFVVPGGVRSRQSVLLVFQMLLSTDEPVSCIQWRGKHYISGEDILRSLSFRLQTERKLHITNLLLFKSRVRALLRQHEHIKATDVSNIFYEITKLTVVLSQATLLSHLAKYRCIRTRKPQKLYVWSSLDHDSLLSSVIQMESQNQRFEKPCSLALLATAGPAITLTSAETISADVSLTFTDSSAKDRRFTHQCEICKATFRRRDHLKRHRTLHTGAKKFCCPTCSKAFGRADTLKTHVGIFILAKHYLRLLICSTVEDSHRDSYING